MLIQSLASICIALVYVLTLSGLMEFTHKEHFPLWIT